ncbi:RNA recognition motif 2-domain-containing protein [Favolaschia claudopus]|uniref:RNA recognition motif 2-domain-containing protein n=1 Tax=Favolaschia claudopus TaxID=2862362 RepID=A0AAW0B887_9AGAR
MSNSSNLRLPVAPWLARDHHSSGTVRFPSPTHQSVQNGGGLLKHRAPFFKGVWKASESSIEGSISSSPSHNPSLDSSGGHLTPANNGEDEVFFDDLDTISTRFLLLRNISRSVSSKDLQSAILRTLAVRNSLLHSRNTQYTPSLSTSTNELASIKGALLRYQESHGIAILAFYDVRQARLAQVLLSTPTDGDALADCIGENMKSRGISGWVDCAFVTAPDLTETVGPSSFLAELQGSFFLSIELVFEPHTSKEDLEKEIGITRVTSLLKLYGALQSFGPAPGMEQTASRKFFCVEYYDVREARVARTELDGKVLYNMRLSTGNPERQDLDVASPARNVDGVSHPPLGLTHEGPGHLSPFGIPAYGYSCPPTQYPYAFNYKGQEQYSVAPNINMGTWTSDQNTMVPSIYGFPDPLSTTPESEYWQCLRPRPQHIASLYYPPLPLFPGNALFNSLQHPLPIHSVRLTGPLIPMTVNVVPLRAAQQNNSSAERNQLNLARIEHGQDTRTTVMIKNIPNRISDKELMAHIDHVCPRKIDFLYLRMDFRTGRNAGYAFVNFITVQDLMHFAKAKLGEKWNMVLSEKVLQMSYADYQGKKALVAKFRNSCIMDKQLSWQPKIFYSDGPKQGLPEPFPEPTRLRVYPGRK